MKSFKRNGERLSSLFVRALESLADVCMKEGRNEEALRWADILLHHDKCWEQAYQLKMQCYGHMNNIPMVVRTYKKCLHCFFRKNWVFGNLSKP